MGQQDPAPAIIVSGSTGWRRGLERMPKLRAKTEEDSLRAPLSAVTPRSPWTGGGGETGTATGDGHALGAIPNADTAVPDSRP